MTRSTAGQFGRNLRQARRRSDLTQQQLAVKAGISASQVYRLETGVREPRLRTVLNLAKALGLDGADLLRGIE